MMSIGSSSLLHKINFDFGVWIFIHGLIFLPFHPHLPPLFSDEIGLVRSTVYYFKKMIQFFILGMRFFRIARILNIPEILQFLHILRSSNSIRLTRILCLLFTVWLSAAGFIHLVRELNNISSAKHSTVMFRWKIPAIFSTIMPILNR